MIELDVPARSLHLDVPEEEMARRRAAWSAPAPKARSGYAWLYVRACLAGRRRADFDFLLGARGDAVPRDSH